jgi:hypothetical protein
MRLLKQLFKAVFSLAFVIISLVGGGGSTHGKEFYAESVKK